MQEENYTQNIINTGTNLAFKLRKFVAVKGIVKQAVSTPRSGVQTFQPERIQQINIWRELFISQFLWSNYLLYIVTEIRFVKFRREALKFLDVPVSQVVQFFHSSKNTNIAEVVDSFASNEGLFFL